MCNSSNSLAHETIFYDLKKKKQKNTTEQIEEPPTDLFNNLLNLLKVANTVEWEDSELTSSHGHTKLTIIYRETIHKSDRKTNRKDLVQLKI